MRYSKRRSSVPKIQNSIANPSSHSPPPKNRYKIVWWVLNGGRPHGGCNIENLLLITLDPKKENSPTHT